MAGERGRHSCSTFATLVNPRVANQFKNITGYAFPHSYTRLPNGNVLATFQVKEKGYEPPGALAEFDASGKLIRMSSADVIGMDKKQLWPYSVLALPAIDRVVTTSTEMGLPKWAQPKAHGTSHETHTLTDTNLDPGMETKGITIVGDVSAAGHER